MRYVRAGLLAALIVLLQAAAADAEWFGSFGIELRGFASGGVTDEQADARFLPSVFVMPEYTTEWDGGKYYFAFSGFARYDEQDSERTQVDVRELYVQRTQGDWDISIGFQKIFWGVTESQHLVDLLNQTDLVEDIDGEQKLGQPMLNVSLTKSWGRLQFFVLPWFRERTFPGRDGRVRFSPRVDVDQASYESSAEEAHVDWALRWSHSVGAFDIGLAYFDGTAREPLLAPGVDRRGDVVLTPFYEQIERASLDLQAVSGGWLWKLEAIQQSGFLGDYFAAIGGFEATLFNLKDSGVDLGLLLEYSYDDRGDASVSAFEDDVFVGARIALNDTQDTDLLMGATIDREDGSAFVDIRGSRRFLEHYRATLTIRAFLDAPPTDIFFTLSREDYVELSISRFF